jgi:hypothetical protein
MAVKPTGKAAVKRRPIQNSLAWMLRSQPLEKPWWKDADETPTEQEKKEGTS